MATVTFDGTTRQYPGQYEPLSNLDAKLRVQTRTEIARLQRKVQVSALHLFDAASGARLPDAPRVP